MATYITHRMDDECCIFMLFFLFRILSEDWYTWMLTETERLQVNKVLLRLCLGEIKMMFLSEYQNTKFTSKVRTFLERKDIFTGSHPFNECLRVKTWLLS